jgi:RHS repeat-associated protein
MNTLRPCLFQKGRICRILLFALSLLLYIPGLFAQESGVTATPIIARLSGATGGLFVGATANLGYPPDNAQVVAKKIVNVITLSIDEESASYIPEDFTASVTVQIDYGIGSTPTDQATQQLTVTYKKGIGITYNPKNYFSFNNAQIVQVTVLSPITAPVLSNGLDTKTLLLLQNEMRVTRYYQLNNNSSLQPTITEYPPAPDELPVSWEWAPDAGNNGTQLEWTWLEEELRDNYTNGNGAIDYDRLFKRNATRIDLPLDTRKYTIPLFYDAGDPRGGILYYRIRATNYVQSGNRQDGPWSDVHYYNFAGHNNKLNWQAATAYGEEGKRKTVMQYYDGSLRIRQTVTKNNSTNTTVSAETFYDGQGRPAIQILPAPGMSNIVTYNENLNRFNGQSAIDDPALAFDLQPATGGSTTDPLIGASALYYSDANTEKSVGANGNIPNAEGYPYSVTRYTPDATGRVMSQSGVGSALKVGSGHETKYYYGNAAPEELDGLFGTDAGNPTHYFKNMVQDANGQMSVSYVDLHGRTIATALAGDTAVGIMSILNETDYPKQTGTPMTRNLLNLNTNVVKGNSIEALNTILVPARTAYKFTYKLDPQELTLATCTAGQSVCYDCMYDLEIAITDESGDQEPIIRKFTNVSLSANNGCNAISAFSKAANETLLSTVANNEIVFTEMLSPGSYAVRKTLTISEASLQQQKEAWLQVGLCKSQQEIINSVYDDLKTTSGCDITDPLTPCQSCIAELGDYTTYRAKYIINLDPGNLPAEPDIHKAYSADSTSCVGLCTNQSHKLDIIRSLMLSDMMPYTGQYAQNPALVDHPSMFDKYNIFSTTNNPLIYKLPPNSFQSTRGFYNDVNGNTDASIHSDPNNPFQKLDGLNADGFTELFTTSWAESLLRFHPEYERLVFAQQNLAASYDWIDNFNQVNKYSDAASYLSATGHPEDFDPFFTIAPLAYKTAMTNFVSGSWYQGLNLWQMAYGDVECKTNTDPDSRDYCYTHAPKEPPFTSFSTDKMNQAWTAFKGFYGMLRDSMVNDYIKVNKPLADESDLVSQKFILRFPTTVSQQITQYEWTDFPTTWGAAPTVSMTGYIATNRTSRCSSYIDEWKRELSQCPAIANSADKEVILTEITSGMEAVCEKGLDGGNPYGSSNFPDTYGNPPRSFEAVVLTVFQAHGIAKDQYCHPFVIESPKPYGKNPVYTQEMITVVDTCNCKQFAKLKQAAAANPEINVADRHSLNLYLKSIYNDTLTQVLFDGLQHCSELGSTVCHLVHVVETVPCNGGGTAAATNTKTDVSAAALPPGTCTIDYYVEQCETLWYIPLLTGQPKPAFLNCGFNGPYCINCAQLSQLISDYKAYFNGLPCAAAPVLSDDGLTSEEISYNETFALFANYRTGFQYSWLQYVKAADGAECNLANYTTNSNATQKVLCADTRPLNDPTGLFVTDGPCQHVHDMSVAIGTAIYQRRKEQLLADFDAQYRAKCLSAKAIEQFTVDYDIKEYHYTLYYYDMAGNLVQTVPPKAARPDFRAQFIADVEHAKSDGTEKTPDHVVELITSYRYNSLNTIIEQKTPDAGISYFWYDKLGRLAISQNALQAITPGTSGGSKYSYTIYDEFGRIKEVGQKPQTVGMDQTTSQNETLLNNWINQGGEAKEQITHTEYDLMAGFNTSGMMTQENLRNRVSYTYTQNKETDPHWHKATIYTYDVAGNVSKMLHDYIGISSIDATLQYKLIHYKYDLVSGKTNEVQYQPGNPDAFYHRYLYDADNRLVEVKTSRDNLVWERDAAYSYYKHGPLQRTVLGQLQTQGMDYNYTLQGWLKGVNVGKSGADASGGNCPSGTALEDAVIYTRPATNAPSTYTARNSITFDLEFANDLNSDEYETVLDNSLGTCTVPGGGGGTGGAITENYPVALDAYTFSLHYYPGDYTPIDNTIITMPVLQNLSAQATPLYNGNIAAMAIDIPRLGTAKVYNYHYDQLNRLKKMDAFEAVNLTVPLDDYKERISYDPNGNITGYLRNGTTSGSRMLAMDNLSYNYYPLTNQLSSVTEAVTATANYTEDIDPQGTNNYIYDAIGNLKTDVAGDISDIKWTVYGKIASISKSTSTITYTYDASGNRLTKTVTPISDGQPHTTIYVRDGQGNVLSVYEKIGAYSLQQTEMDLIGSKRLGIIKIPYQASPELTVVRFDMGVYGTGIVAPFTRGQKVYELANHLGNVLATVSDKKVGVPSPGNISLDHYTADVTSAQDYYPFGMLMPGRSYAQNGTYRYGFNGKENDNEVKGEGNQQDYGMRIYDPRVGRFLSVDPIANQYPELTPYQYASNRPVDGVDQDGLEWYYYNFLNGWTESKYPKSIFLTEIDANKAGYLSLAQVHKLQENQAREAKLEEDRIKYEEAVKAKQKINFLNNPAGIAYELSVQTGVDAYNAYSNGHYVLGSLMIVGAAADFAPLFKTFGKAYAGVARGFANMYTFEGIWGIKNNFARGAIYEAKVSAKYISKGFTWLAESASQFFRGFDFYHVKDAMAVSLKTVNAEKNFNFTNILENIKQLESLKKTGSSVQYGIEYKIKDVELHIATPKGYDRSVLQGVETEAKTRGVTIKYIEE